jgi:hypothetical protein
MLHPMPGMLGAEIIGPISAEDRRVFLLNQKLRKQRINAVLGAASAARGPTRALSLPATSVVGHDGAAQVIDEEEDAEPLMPARFSKRSLKISTYLAYFLFLLCGIGYQIQFSSITSAIVYFKGHYGPSIFRIIVGAFNAPLLPILLLQLKFDQKLDVRFGSTVTFSVRLFSTMIICTGILYTLPWLDKPLWVFTCLVAMLGIFNAVATGAYFSLVSVFPIKTPIFWAVGQRLSTALILGIQFLLLTPSLSEESENMYYFLSCATVSLLGVIMAFILMNLPATTYQLLARDEQIREEMEQCGMQAKVSKWELLKKVWPTTLAGGLILFADVAVVTTFTYFPSAQNNGDLSLILLYINYFADFAGRQLVLIPYRVVWNQPTELIASLIRFLWVPASLVYIKVDLFRNDWALYVFIGAYAVLGGYIRTMVFTIGPQAVSLNKRTEVSIILNLGITFGVYAGIAFSFIAGSTFL